MKTLPLLFCAIAAVIISFFVLGEEDQLGFGPDIINRLPPTTAEWHSMEGIAFAEESERAGLSWAEAHLRFTDEVLSSRLISPNRLEVFSGKQRSGFIDLLGIERSGSMLHLRLITSPEFGSFQSSRQLWLSNEGSVLSSLRSSEQLCSFSAQRAPAAVTLRFASGTPAAHHLRAARTTSDFQCFRTNAPLSSTSNLSSLLCPWVQISAFRFSMFATPSPSELRPLSAQLRPPPPTNVQP